MGILINSRRKVPGLENRKIKQALKKVLEDLGNHDRELSILFTDDEHITQLNRQYLNRDRPTNVLAFPVSRGSAEAFEEHLLGDVVISVDTAAREAEQARVSMEERIYRLLLHGLLHLLRYDHEESEEEADRMEREEQRLFELISAGNKAQDAGRKA